MTTPMHSDRVSILVVDDHHENVLALQAMLSRADYEVVGAGSGSEALKRILKQEFAVILLDVLMPVMDGFETARLIRQREASRSVPIIFLTANAAEVGLVYQGYAVGAVDYMIKPLDPDIVRAKVAVFVDLFRKTQQVRLQEEKLREAERRRSEHALRRSEVLYEATFDEAAVGIGHAATDGRWLRVNRKLCDVLGYAEDEALHLRLQDVTHPDDVAATVAALRRMAAGEFDTFRREQRCLTKDGNIVWVNLMLSVLRGSGAVASQFITVVEDVTERKLAADRQRVLSAVSERLLGSLDYRRTLDEVASALVPALADWCVLEVSGAEGEKSELVAAHAEPSKAHLVRELGERAASDPRRAPAAGLDTGSSALITNAADSVLGALVADVESRKRLGELGCDSVMVVPLAARNRSIGTITLVAAGSGRRYGSQDLAVAEDLGNRVALAIENARLYQKAQEAISARDEFLSIASHELRTPLTPLQITFQRLLRERSRERLDKVEGERLRTMLTRCERQVHRLAALIDNLLDVSRISSGRLRLQRERLDLSEVVREVVSRFTEELSRAQCTIELRIDGSVVGDWDRLRVEQVVTNLLGNALKYGASKPIEIQVGGSQRHAQLSVRDHGIGIEPASIARIFDRFERAVSSRSYGGLGLGLYITRQIVEAHGGTIRVSSELGSGSQFVVELPTEAADASDRESDAGNGGLEQRDGQQAFTG
jgi:PAS domain S-box-containing protein